MKIAVAVISSSMQESFQQLEDFVARRLLTKATVTDAPIPTPTSSGITPINSLTHAEQESQESLDDIEFIKIEKNLAELGFSPQPASV